MHNMQYEFRLFGGRAGQTCVINGHKFIQGIYRRVLTPHAAAPLTKVLSFYGAYLKGSPEYDAALAREQGHGTDEVSSGAKCRAADPVHDAVQSDGAGSSEAGNEDSGAGAVGSEAASAGSGAAGDGHADSGVPKFEESSSLPEPSEPASVGSTEIKEAILTLDPENEDHWVRTGAAAGKPKLSAVESAYGKAGLTRADLEAALPGWSRDQAIQAMLES